jgi:hypothetical protein
MYNQGILTDDQIHRLAPSVFADRPWSGVSENYRFIPTTDLVAALREEGLVPVRARQGRTRIEGKGFFTKHELRFQRRQDIEARGNSDRKVGQVTPEIIVTNSHDRTSCFDIKAGLFRLVCLNGMTVAEAMIGRLHVRHSGNIGDVVGGALDIVESFPRILARVEDFRSVELTERQRNAFAEAALVARYGEEAPPVQPYQLLRANRWEDQGNDLWTTFNRVQENLTKGSRAIRWRSESGRRASLRAVTSIDGDQKLNMALWTLAEKLRESI